MLNNSVKLYSVVFNQYSDCLNNAVSYEDPDTQKTRYLHIPKTGLVVREDKLQDYAKFGNGFSSISIVGEIYDEDPLAPDPYEDELV